MNIKKLKKRIQNAKDRSNTVKGYLSEWKGFSPGPPIVDEISLWDISPTHEISIKGNIRSDDPPLAICTCGWTLELSTSLMKLGLAAKKHAQENPGHVLRSHK